MTLWKHRTTETVPYAFILARDLWTSYALHLQIVFAVNLMLLSIMKYSIVCCIRWLAIAVLVRCSTIVYKCPLQSCNEIAHYSNLVWLTMRPRSVNNFAR